ncbi:type II toxin-antitoxin system HipA family toxin [Marinomonas sp. A79]|uniref:Type II toxin-antitoxin system HipA family toxin n=1 Tax=Marinomonas vulgaris TaxID=2823372 RepID=A0ABS5H933_9GAMM|nr:HipA domain-containing protein [Marinomonas vulgaris]MBR7888211.1 type II toxin-antitoxin system HipA family toxin [Marinomonas vulgaris]
MKTLTLQALIEQQWWDIATLQLLSPKKGTASPCRLGYEFDYSVTWLDRHDEHACSLVLPVQIMIEHEADRWFGFLEDIVPAGAARRYLVDFWGLQALSSGEQDTTLLEKGTIAPVGNVRIKESLPSIPSDSTLHLRKFTLADVVERDSSFLEYAQEMGAISGGATGAGGEAPKLLLRCSEQNEIWIDTFQEQHNIADAHYLVKFPRGRKTQDDCDILRAEYHFYHELTAMGFNTINTEKMKLLEGSRYPSLWLPRFDTHWDKNHWDRYGLESIFSVLNKPAGSYLNHFEVIHSVCDLLQKQSASFDATDFVCDWLTRDLLNIAFGNSDNHGRNTALLKKPSNIWLSPIYDFAPMKVDPEGITRTTKWGPPFEEGGEYRWQAITEALNNLCPSETSLLALKQTANKLKGLQQRLETRGVPKRILEVIQVKWLDTKLARWGLL